MNKTEIIRGASAFENGCAEITRHLRPSDTTIRAALEASSLAKSSAALSAELLNAQYKDWPDVRDVEELANKIASEAGSLLSLCELILGSSGQIDKPIGCGGFEHAYKFQRILSMDAAKKRGMTRESLRKAAVDTRYPEGVTPLKKPAFLAGERVAKRDPVAEYFSFESEPVEAVEGAEVPYV